MKIALCDDENIFNEQLKKMIQEYFAHSGKVAPAIKVYNSGEVLVRDAKNIDIVFLDVEMVGESGIDVACELKKNNSHIIINIVTSHEEYLDEAMRLQVFGFLPKPVDKYRLYRNLKYALSAYYENVSKVMVETKNGNVVIYETDIIFIAAYNRYTRVYTKNEEYDCTSSIIYWSDQLKCKCFFQPHRSYLINMEYVSSFNDTEICLFKDKYKVYLSRRRYKIFKDIYYMYLESVR